MFLECYLCSRLCAERLICVIPSISEAKHELAVIPILQMRKIKSRTGEVTCPSSKW